VDLPGDNLDPRLGAGNSRRAGVQRRSGGQLFCAGRANGQAVMEFSDGRRTPGVGRDLRSRRTAIPGDANGMGICC